MTIYNCKECNFIEDNNFNYQKHLKTKKHQKNMREIEDDKRSPKTTICKPNEANCKPNEANCKPNEANCKSSIQQCDNILYECDYCDVSFKHRQSKYKHQKYSCKAKKNQEKTSEENIMLLQRVEYLEKMLNDAMKKINTTNINTTNTNCMTNNIIINGYGKEDISYIKDSEWLKMLTNPRESITKLFLETHFNPEHPENTNIRQRNRNSKFIEVHDGDNWKNKKKKKMLSDVADDKQGILDDKFIKDDDIQNSMSERQKQSHSLYHDEVFYNDKKEIVEEMEACLLDGP